MYMYVRVCPQVCWAELLAVHTQETSCLAATGTVSRSIPSGTIELFPSQTNKSKDAQAMPGAVCFVM